MASTERVLDILSLKPKITGGSQSFPTNVPSIVYQGVHFSYDGRETLLKDFTMTVQASKTTAIVGATGSGKSTLLRLLLRFYEHEQGAVLIDGEDIRSLSIQSIRQNTALVSQSVYLFDGTILENISYGCSAATLEDIKQAARAAEAEAFILQLPDGYQANP